MSPIEPVAAPGTEVPAIGPVDRRDPEERRQRERERRRRAARAADLAELAAVPEGDHEGDHVDVRA